MTNGFDGGDQIAEISFPVPPVTEANRCNPLKIAYIGPAHGTSLQRARALERLGHFVSIVDPWAWLGNSKWVARWEHHAGAWGSNIIISNRIHNEVKNAEPDLIWVNQGEFLGPRIIKKLRKFGVPIINLANDNPFTANARMRFWAYRAALPYYDLVALPRQESVNLAIKHGATHSIRIWFCSDEVEHDANMRQAQGSVAMPYDVSFVGTWMTGRGAFMATLIRRGVPLSIWGDRWQKAPEWEIIAPYWRGSNLTDQYSSALRSSKICLGLLSKENRDLHTTRSIEIPALGCLFCAERTPEHQALYDDRKEAVFWDDANECADLCHYLLNNEEERRLIALNGYRRARKNNLFNEPVLAALIRAIFEGKHDN